MEEVRREASTQGKLAGHAGLRHEMELLEREREAAEIRAQGQEAAQRIRSRADRDVTVLIAEAEREASASSLAVDKALGSASLYL